MAKSKKGNEVVEAVEEVETVEEAPEYVEPMPEPEVNVDPETVEPVEVAMKSLLNHNDTLNGTSVQFTAEDTLVVIKVTVGMPGGITRNARVELLPEQLLEVCKQLGVL